MVAKELDAELQVQGRAKTEVKAVVLQALVDRSLLKGTMTPTGLESELKLQHELKRLELDEAERCRQFEREKDRERRKQKTEIV